MDKWSPDDINELIFVIGVFAVVITIIIVTQGC